MNSRLLNVKACFGVLVVVAALTIALGIFEAALPALIGVAAVAVSTLWTARAPSTVAEHTSSSRET